MISGTAALAALLATVAAVGQRPVVRSPRHRRRAGVVVGIAGLIALAATASPIALIGTIGAVSVGVDMVRRERQRRHSRRLASLAPVALEVTAARLRGGATLVVALGELDADQRRSVGLDEAMAAVDSGRALSDVLASGDVRTAPGLVAAAVLILDRTGAPAAGVVERVADRLRARNAGASMARSESGQQLASAAVMAGLPILTAVGLIATSDGAADFYLHTAGGAALLLVSSALSVASWYWMRALLTRDLRW